MKNFYLTFLTHLLIGINCVFAQEFTSTPVKNATYGEAYNYHVTTDRNEQIYGDYPTWLTLQNNQNGEADLTGTPTEVGTFDVNLKFNIWFFTYSQSYQLTVGKADAGIVISGLQSTYTGKPQTINVSTSPANLGYTVFYNGSTDLPVEVGQYDIKVVIDDPHYKGEESALLTINKATATITFSDLQKEYNGEPQQPTITTVPEGLDYTLTFDGASEAPREEGSYKVMATIEDDTYMGSASTTFTIVQMEEENAKPVISNVEKQPLMYVQGDGGRSISETLIINDFDNAYMKSATIKLEDNYNSSEDALSFDNSNFPEIEAQWDSNTGTLTLEGEDTRSHYESALINVKYSNSVLGETDIVSKRLSIIVNDGFNNSDPVSRDIEITILPDIGLVNAFTPNNDGINDTWDFQNLDRYESINISVYEDNGQEVYKCSGTDCQWDGTYQGKELSGGAYYYIISLNGGKREYKGIVTVLK